MGKLPSLMIILALSLLFLLQTFEGVNGATCYGSLATNSSYSQNRRDLFSTLANKVVTNGGVYNASLGQYPNKVYVLGLCARGYEPNACSNCVDSLAVETQNGCANTKDSFVWGSDDEDRVSCLVRSSNHSFGNLEVSPPVTGPSPDHVGPSVNLTLFLLQWEYTVNRTLEAATKANTSSAHKYYSASYAEFTEFPNVYMLMQCTPDITSQGCKQCLGACLKYFREQFRGRTGGMVSFPSCFLRWDLYIFHGAFVNVTRVPALPRPPAEEKESSNKKGRSMLWVIITIAVVLTFINVLVFIGFYKVNAWRRKINNGLNVGGAEYSDSDGQFMLRYDLGMILSATADFSPKNKLGQGGFGTVYKGKLLNGKEIAVKRLTRGSEGEIEFKNEVSLLTRLQHKNLVKLLGFCSEGDEEILVYEFVPHSSLDRFIFDEESVHFLYGK